MNTLKAFHNDKEIKNKYLNRVIAHRKADEIVKGSYWENGKGCAVGCTIHGSTHSAYETELGIPEWLAKVEDGLFEGMSDKKCRLWPEKFLKAIPLGVNLDKAKAPFLILVLESCLNNFDHEKFPKVKKALKDSIALWKRKDLGSDEWNLARDAAKSAAESAASSAAWSAAWSAAKSAEWSAAMSAASSAEWSAAMSAASSAAFNSFADKLLKILEGLK